MFDHYFTYWDDLPADGGYPLFGGVHLAWLFGIAATIILCVICLRRQSPALQNRLLKILAFILLALETYREIVLAVTGHFSFQTLPLHLCSLAIFIEAIFAFFPKAFFGELVCVVILPAATAGLLCPDWLRYPTLNYMNIHGFASHGILVLFSIITLLSGKYRPRIRRIYMSLLFFAVAVPVIYRLNVWQGTNFMFLNRPSTGSPFETIYEAYGYTAYLAVFSATVLALILAMYSIIGLVYFVKDKKHSTNSKAAAKNR
ncbi:MAG: TIGR02206 family membrane protein [Lachnospiraceae bacterium]|nr:TIGR02206 family membrane protein [Lachnospiraceae bacterium]